MNPLREYVKSTVDAMTPSSETLARMYDGAKDMGRQTFHLVQHPAELGERMYDAGREAAVAMRRRAQVLWATHNDVFVPLAAFYGVDAIAPTPVAIAALAGTSIVMTLGKSDAFSRSKRNLAYLMGGIMAPDHPGLAALAVGVGLLNDYMIAHGYTFEAANRKLDRIERDTGALDTQLNLLGLRLDAVNGSIDANRATVDELDATLKDLEARINPSKSI